MTKTVWILALDEVLDSSLAITLDLLRAAQSIAAQRRTPLALEMRVLGARRLVRTGCGLVLRADDTFRNALAAAPARRGRPDWAIVPAMGQYGTALVEHLARPDAVQARELLAALAGRRVPIGASCASVFLLAEAGLLEGRAATTTWWVADHFRRRYPGVELDERRMVVRDGAMLTAGSAFSQLDLMLAVLADLGGLQLADDCARYLLIDRRPSQARYMVAAHTRHHDPLVAAAEAWVDRHLGEASITVERLAGALATTPRTLSRKVLAATGFPAIKLIQRRRLMMATHLLETTRLPLEQVAERVGYATGTTLRRLLRRELDTSPSALR